MANRVPALLHVQKLHGLPQQLQPAEGLAIRLDPGQRLSQRHELRVPSSGQFRA